MKRFLWLLLVGAVSTVHAESPFRDAFGVWHLADAKDLKVIGAVKLDVPLAGPEAAESRKRGGDGKVAVFDGGYLDVGALNLPGQSFTVALRLRDLQGAWNSPILGRYGDKAQASYYLRAVNGAGQPMLDRQSNGREVPTIFKWLYGTPGGPKAVSGHPSFLEFVWGAAKPDATRVQRFAKVQDKNFSLYDDASHGLMRVGFPVQTMGPNDWHDLILRFTGPKLQFFIDGALVDEEFPIGETRQNDVPCLIGAGVEDGKVVTGFHGSIDHVAMWKRALSDAEIVELSGGAEQVARRDEEIHGPQPEQMQYFRPRGYNAKAGDCIPFWHDGTFHLFYLQLRRNRHSKWDWGHGALEIYHASTRDLKTWRHHPVAVPISEQWQAWNGTGGFAYHDGQFHLFHPCPSYNKEWPYTGIQLVTSRDGEHFTKQQPHPFMEGGDCEIYRDETTGLFHMLKGAVAPKGRTKLVRLVSSDLREWKPVPETFLETDAKYGVRTCPHLFGWKGSFYFMGGNTIWTSSQPFGPWTIHSPVRLEQLSVPKTAPFPGDRRLLAGFLIDGGWGGNLIVRELVQQADGALGSKFVPEMIPAAGQLLALAWQTDAKASGAKIEGGTATLIADREPASAFIAAVPQNVRISLEVLPASPQTRFNLGLRGRDSATESCQLEFDPAKKLVQWRTMTDSAMRRTVGPRAEDIDLPAKPIRLEFICRGDIVDVEIDGRRTLANRYWDLRGDRFFVQVEKGCATVRDVQIRPLIDRP